MLSRPVILLLLLAFAAVASACSTDEDCSLNGVCTQGACVCDPAWTASDCGMLNLLPTPLLQAFHGKGLNTTKSWGGSIHRLQGKEAAATDANFVMFAAEWPQDGTWYQNSSVVVATATEPTGPYTEIAQAVPQWAHNPEAIYVPASTSTPTPEPAHYCIYTLGDGAPAPPKPAPTPSPAPTPATNTTVSFVIHYTNTSYIGPFYQHTAQIVDFPTSYSFPGNWNPAPVLLPSGRVRIAVHTDTQPWAGIVIVEAASWRGPYHPLTTDITTCTKCEEDPFMWYDHRGNWHLLFHRMFDGPEGPSSSPVPSPGWAGGHSFSRDGLKWSPITRSFNTTVHFTDGSQQELVRRERPKLLFAADGVTPTHMSNGAVDQYNWHTLVVPLGTAPTIN